MPELIVRKWDGPYSFMVFKEYGVWKARRGDNGEIQFEDIKPAEVLQSAIDALPEGGTVFLKEDLCDCTGEDIVLKKGVSLKGEGWFSNWARYAYIPRTGTALKCNTLKIEGSSTAAEDRIRGVKVENLFVNGKISIKYGSVIDLEGIYVDAGGQQYGIKIDSSWGTKLSSVRVDSADYGIYIHNENPADSVSSVFMDLCLLHDNEYGIYGDDDLPHTIFFANGWIEPKRAFYGYALDLCNSKIVMGNYDYNAIECFALRGANLILSGSNNGAAIKVMDYGEVQVNSAYIGAFNSALRAGSHAKIYLDGHLEACDYVFDPAIGSNVRAFIRGTAVNISGGLGGIPSVYDYDGYTNSNVKSRNSGAAKIAAGNTQVEVNHGLAIEPDINKIQVTPRGDTGGKRWWISFTGVDPASKFLIKIDSAHTSDIWFGWRII